MIKNILVLIFAIFLMGCSNSAALAKKSSKIEKKTTIYYIHRSGCPACSYMDEVLKQKEIKQTLQNSFKLVTLDFTNQTALPDSSMVTNKTPTLYFVKDGKQIHKPINAVNANRFKEILEELR